MSKEILQNNDPSGDEPSGDIDGEWRALNNEGEVAADAIRTETYSDAVFSEAIRADLKHALMEFSDKVLLIPDAHSEKHLLMNLTNALGMLLSPREWRSDKSRMGLALGPLAKAFDEVKERYERLARG